MTAVSGLFVEAVCGKHFYLCFPEGLSSNLSPISLHWQLVHAPIPPCFQWSCYISVYQNAVVVFLSQLFPARLDYRSAVMIDEAKRRESDARKAYEKMKKNRSLKLYDKPPHLRNPE